MLVYWKPAWSQFRQLSSSHLSGLQQVRIWTQYLVSTWYLFVIDRAGSLEDIIFNRHSPSLFTRIFGLSPSYSVARYEFFTTYVISIISAALGLAKCLKNGVARPIAPGGPLDGLLSGKFLLAFLASGFGLVARGFCIAFSWVKRIFFKVINTFEIFLYSAWYLSVSWKCLRCRHQPHDHHPPAVCSPVPALSLLHSELP